MRSDLAEAGVGRSESNRKRSSRQIPGDRLYAIDCLSCPRPEQPSHVNTHSQTHVEYGHDKSVNFLIPNTKIKSHSDTHPACTHTAPASLSVQVDSWILVALVDLTLGEKTPSLPIGAPITVFMCQ